MNLHRALIVTASLFGLAVGPVWAQSPWPEPAQQAPSPWPGQQPAAPQQPAPEPWPTQPQPAVQGPAQAPAQPWPQQQAQPQEPPCMADFTKLRNDAAKKGSAIQAASGRQPRPTAKEACGLFNAFSAAEAKMVKFVAEKATTCGIPPEVLSNMKQQHAKTNEIRTRVCQAAAAGPPPPRGPSLSDALGSPVPDTANIKTGRGTYDTLTGTPLGK